MYVCNSTADFSITEKDAAKQFLKANRGSLLDNQTKATPLQKTDFYMLHSRDYIYLYYKANDDMIVANYTGYNDALYNEDAVELFISPSGERTEYFEYEVSPRNVAFLGKIANDLNGGVRLTYLPEFIGEKYGYITPFGYEVFMKIPKIDLKIDEEKTVFNVFRVDNNGEELELYSLSQTGVKNFHIPKCFINLLFTK